MCALFEIRSRRQKKVRYKRGENVSRVFFRGLEKRKGKFIPDNVCILPAARNVHMGVHVVLVAVPRRLVTGDPGTGRFLR